MEINKEFFNNYSVKKLVREGNGASVMFYLKMITSPFYSEGIYQVVAEDTAIEQLSIEFETDKSVVAYHLEKLNESTLITEYYEYEDHSIKIPLENGLME